MYKRNGSFFKSLIIIAGCMLALAMVSLPVQRSFAQSADLATTPDKSQPTAADLEVGPDPVTTPASDTASQNSAGGQVLPDNTSTVQEPLPSEDGDPLVKIKQPPLNRYLSESIGALQDKANSRPVWFSAVLTGLVLMLLILAVIRGRHQQRNLSYIAPVRHRLSTLKY